MGGRAEDAVKHGVLLAAVLILAAFLRFDGLGVPSYWLDEILHQYLTTDAAAQPWWRWIIGFSPEHGPLYYASQLAARPFGSSETAGRFPAALFGLATVPLVWLAMRRRDAVTAIVSAILLAVSPLHVYYSREARAYALLMFLTAALMVVLLRARSIAAACLVIVALLYSSATAAPIVAGALIVAGLSAFLVSERVTRRWYLIVAGVSAGALALFPLLYATKPVENAGWPAFPVLDGSFFSTLMRMFSVSAMGAHIGGRAAVAMLLLAVPGAVALVRRNRVEGVVIAGMALLPLLVSLATLKLLNHFYAGRYVTPSLVGYVILAGAGIAALASAILKRAPLVLAVVAAAALASQGWKSARTEAFQKLDWRAVAAKIWRYAWPEDVIIADQPWSEVSLRYYLRPLPKRATLEGVPYVSVAQAVSGAYPAAWLVTAGGDNEVRSWMCRYPMVLGSPLERFRLHYTGDFLRERAGPAEWRAASAAIGPRLLIDLAAAENRYFDAGWADPEGFRWAMGTHASVAFPRWGRRDRTIRMRVLPFHHGSLPPQTLRASLNGRPVGELTPAPGWTEQSIAVPAAVWRDGLNTLAFDFGRAAAPADLDPKATDHRQLAVAFSWIAIEDGPPAAPGQVYSPRLASGAFIDEQTVWRNSRTRFPPASLRRQPVEALIGRLGFDPMEIWPRLARGEIRLDNIVETIAYGSDCEDDHAFFRRAFGILLQRPPEPAEERELAKLPRVRAVGRMIKSDEFRRAVSATAPGQP